MIGCCEDGVEVDLSCYAGRVIPVPDLLAMKAAGYQAALIWLQGRGIDGSTPPYDLARDTLADHDISWCLDTCRRFCRPDLSMQDGIKGAWRILACQWGAVLRLADALASRGVLAGPTGSPTSRRTQRNTPPRSAPTVRGGTGPAIGVGGSLASQRGSGCASPADTGRPTTFRAASCPKPAELASLALRSAGKPVVMTV